MLSVENVGQTSGTTISSNGIEDTTSIYQLDLGSISEVPKNVDGNEKLDGATIKILKNNVNIIPDSRMMIQEREKDQEINLVNTLSSVAGEIPKCTTSRQLNDVDDVIDFSIDQKGEEASRTSKNKLDLPIWLPMGNSRIFQNIRTDRYRKFLS